MLQQLYSVASTLFGIVLLVYWVGVVILLIQEDRDPTTTLAWLLLLILLPFVGLVVYFFLGRDWPAITQKSKRARAGAALEKAFMAEVYKRFGESTGAVEITERSACRISSAITAQGGGPALSARSFLIYTSGEEYFPVLLEDLRSAKRFIHMQYFIWERDALTAQVTEVLLERLAAGVEVRILNDWWGNLQYRKDQLARLRHAGAKVGADVTDLGRINYRNHRKITVVDGLVGHTGGFNIGQEYADGGRRFPAWRDTGLRVEGRGVCELERLFGRRWYEVYEEDLFRPEYYPPAEEPAGDVAVQTASQGVEEVWHAAKRTYEIAISGARERVLLQSPYFVPDPTSLDALVNAALSGVEVHFMMTGWPDKRIAYYAAESFYWPFLAAGGHLWRYESGFMHAKSLTVDGCISAIGTMNMDVRSLKLHKELVVWSYDAAVARRCEDIFEADLAHCREVSLAEIESWGGARRFRNSACRLVSNLL